MVSLIALYPSAQRVLNAVVIVVALLWISTASYTWFQGAGDPFVIEEGRFDNPIVHYGTPLLLVGQGSRTRLCPSESHRTIVDATGAIVWREIKPNGIPNVGMHQRARIFIDLPPALKPGKYIYSSLAYTVCDGKTYTAIGKPLPFEIIE